MKIEETIDKYLTEIKKYDDVNIISKNKTGMVYDIIGSKVKVKTASGTFTVDIKDVKVIKSED